METLLARLDDPAIEGGLFHDIGIVPAHFYPGRRDGAQTEPIRKLMTAILVDAVQCYRTGQRQNAKGTEALEVNIWIFGSYAEFPFSFTNVCTELGLSPDHVRLQLRDGDKQASADPRRSGVRRFGHSKCKASASDHGVDHAEERGIHLWIPRVTPFQQQRRIVDFRLFVKWTLYSRCGGPF